MSPYIEIGYCKTCRKIEYSKWEYWSKYRKDFKNNKKCELCLEKDGELDHHITYNPATIIRLCRSCHGKLHKKRFS